MWLTLAFLILQRSAPFVNGQFSFGASCGRNSRMRTGAALRFSQAGTAPRRENRLSARGGMSWSALPPCTLPSCAPLGQRGRTDETAGLFLAQRKKISPKACAFEDTAMELLSRFELETSSLPIIASVFCAFWPFAKNRIDAQFLLCVFCMQAYSAADFCGHSPQIHPKTKQKHPRVTPSRCSTGAFVVFVV